MSPMTPLVSSALSNRRSDISRWVLQFGAVLLGSSLLWASAKVQVPFWPVPMTMQTYVVLAMGAVLGPRLGAAAVGAYLAEGAAGLPVFAGTPANGVGLAYMVGPTGGYLGGYLAAVVLVGASIEKQRNYSLLVTAVTMLIGELAIIGFGCVWLAVQFGWERALTYGFGPFLVGDGAKLALALGTVACVKHASATAGE